MMAPLIYIACTSHHLGRLAVEVDAHVNPRHKALRYATRAFYLAGTPRGSLYIDLLDRGSVGPHVHEMREILAAREMRPMEIWKLRSVLREFGIE